MATAHQIAAALGGAETFGAPIGSVEELRLRVREGIPYASFEHLADAIGLTAAELEAAVGVAPRTRARRRQARRLAPDESDRLVRLARVVATAAEVLGDTDRAARWLRRPNRSLGGEAPLELLDTDLGAQQVEAALGRLDHGVVG